MRIACPSCAAEYEVPDSMLAGHSQVRCVRCGEEWRPGAEPEPAEEGEDEGETLPAVAEPREVAVAEEKQVPVVAGVDHPPSLFVPPREPRTAASRELGSTAAAGVLLGWVLTVLVIGSALYAGYAYRDQLMTAWPPSTRLYAALGLRG